MQLPILHSTFVVDLVLFSLLQRPLDPPVSVISLLVYSMYTTVSLLISSAILAAILLYPAFCWVNCVKTPSLKHSGGLRGALPIQAHKDAGIEQLGTLDPLHV